MSTSFGKQDSFSMFSRRSFCTKGLASSAYLLARSSWARALAESPVVGGASEGDVPTLTGFVSSGQLGTTLMHEHVLFGDIPEELRDDSVDFAVKLLNDASRAGVETVVDLTPFRDIKLYQQIASRTPVRIIASTGYYLRDRVPKWMAEMSDEKQLEERMMREVADGIEGTKVRPGIIKVAGDKSPLSEWEKKVFRAAARVQRATGIRIATHAVYAPREQFDLLVEAGADPKRLFFSHPETKICWQGHTREQKAEEFISIAKEGGYILFNNFGQDFYTPWPDMVFLMRTLCDRGYANRMFISVDCNWEWKNKQRVFEAEDAPYLDPNATKRTYAYMMTDVVPTMLKSGFSKKEIDTFLVENPGRFFS
jgi:phosphotriesterase-related protein